MKTVVRKLRLLSDGLVFLRPSYLQRRIFVVHSTTFFIKYAHQRISDKNYSSKSFHYLTHGSFITHYDLWFALLKTKIEVYYFKNRNKNRSFEFILRER